jgi:hypothetical protein
MSGKEILVYASDDRQGDVEVVVRILNEYNIPHRRISIDCDPAALGRILLWTGHRSVPTLVAVDPGEDDPCHPPQPIKYWASPRGVDRGSIISEPSQNELLAWLRRLGLIVLAGV